MYWSSFPIKKKASKEIAKIGVSHLRRRSKSTGFTYLTHTTAADFSRHKDSSSPRLENPNETTPPDAERKALTAVAGGSSASKALPRAQRDRLLQSLETAPHVQVKAMKRFLLAVGFECSCAYR